MTGVQTCALPIFAFPDCAGTLGSFGTVTTTGVHEKADLHPCGTREASLVAIVGQERSAEALQQGNPRLERGCVSPRVEERRKHVIDR